MLKPEVANDTTAAAPAALSTREEQGVTVVGFAQRTLLDVATVDDIAPALLALAERPGPTRLVIDFANVSFLSSHALSLLLRLRRRADLTGGEILLAQLRTELARLLRMTRLDKVFLIFESVDDAIRHFR